MLLAGDELGRVAAWDLAAKNRLLRSGIPKASRSVYWQLPGCVREMRTSPDGRYLGTANCDGSIYLLRVDKLRSSSPAASTLPQSGSP